MSVKPQLLGIALVIGGALLLSTKGVFAKLIYARDVDYLTLVAVRAMLSLPVFWAWGIWRAGPRTLLGVDRKAMLAAGFAGFACYYVGSLLDFYALTLIDAGLERVILFTYPTLVVVAQAAMSRRFPSAHIVAATLITYAGIFLSMGGFDVALVRANLSGTLLVLICAATLAFYFIVNERVGRSSGSIAFTVYAMTAASAALVAHFFVQFHNEPVNLDSRAWGLIVMLVAFATVAPLFMLAEGVRIIGAQRAALLSTIGPPSTILIAWLILNETMSPAQLGGAGLIILGILLLETGGSRSIGQ